MKPLSELITGVSPSGDFLVYDVQSKTRSKIIHRVDMSANSGLGRCSCESGDFNGACWHIRRVRKYIATAACQEVIKQRLQEANENRIKVGKTPLSYKSASIAI